MRLAASSSSLPGIVPAVWEPSPWRLLPSIPMRPPRRFGRLASTSARRKLSSRPLPALPAGHSELATKADLKDFATRGDLAAGLARLEARIYLAFLAFALANAALTVAIIKLLL